MIDSKAGEEPVKDTKSPPSWLNECTVPANICSLSVCGGQPFPLEGAGSGIHCFFRLFTTAAPSRATDNVASMETAGSPSSTETVGSSMTGSSVLA